MFSGFSHFYNFQDVLKVIFLSRASCPVDINNLIQELELSNAPNFISYASGANHIWLGGHNQITHGHNNLVWEDGQKVNYTNWLNGIYSYVVLLYICFLSEDLMLEVSRIEAVQSSVKGRFC